MSSARIREAAVPPWYSLLTVDLIWHVLKRSFLHWFIAWMIPLSLIALGHSAHSSIVLVSCIYAAAIDIVTLLFIIDDRIAYGSPNPVNLAEQVIVITGGANGLGLVLAQMLGMKGAAVAVLDIATPSDAEEVKGVTFFQVDAGSPSDITKAEKQIREQLGPATIVINNAAVLSAKPVWDMDEVECTQIFRVNALSHVHTVRAFLPNMLAAGHGSVVTISSILGRLGCANLSGYTASKAALLALHSSLRADLRALASSNVAAANIKTVLVTPGQLNTRMFGDVTTPSALLAPLVESVELAREIVRFLEEGRSGEICMPLYTRFIPWLDVVPAGVARMVRWASGMDEAMSVAVRVPRSGEKDRR